MGPGRSSETAGLGNGVGPETFGFRDPRVQFSGRAHGSTSSRKRYRKGYGHRGGHCYRQTKTSFGPRSVENGKQVLGRINGSPSAPIPGAGCTSSLGRGGTGAGVPPADRKRGRRARGRTASSSQHPPPAWVHRHL
ncbi:Hypothetical predicted protein [Marmota monax]|uniref:Uncharacterized protein n=1 Tax=Marmota monax TaxID=9995 RepID=A0A5E4CBT0_MARMO|nr:Hypothetical predicted protein [Marmota monax]